jgi:hypothetical protein
MLHHRTIPSNTATAVERRVYFVLRDATDLITPEDITVTGVKVSLSLNGGSLANSTNDIVKVSGTVGLYYLELTQTEANQTRGAEYIGHLQPSGCARCYLSADIGPVGLLDDPVELDVTDGVVKSNAVQMNSTNIVGTGVAGDLWRGEEA